MIVAVSPDGVIGIAGAIPWHYKADMARFKRLTTGATVIMGRTTFESIGRPLPNRRNIVVTSRPIEGVEHTKDLASAIARAGGRVEGSASRSGEQATVQRGAEHPVIVYLIGGARIYAEGMAVADFIDVTYVPDRVPVEGAVLFPPITSAFVAGPRTKDEDDPRLERCVFTRRRP
jgi:dihydrofolate reductase